MKMQSLSLREAMNFTKTELQKKKSLDFEIYGNRLENLEVQVKQQKIETYEESFNQGIGLRIFQKNRFGFGFCNSLTPKALKHTIDQVLELSKWSREDPDQGLPDPAQGPYPQMSLWDPQVKETTQREKIAVAMQLEEYAYQESDAIETLQEASLAEHREWIHLQNSRGLNLSHQETSYIARLGVITDSSFYGDFIYSSRFRDLKPRQLAKTVVERALQSLAGRKLKSGSYRVLLENQAVAELLEFLAPAFSSERIHKKTSYFENKFGQKIFSEKLSFIDDATVPHQMGSSPFDGEGTPSQKNILVQEGILQNALYDSHSARKEGKKSSGNSVREGFADIPTIATTNFFLKPGKKPFQDLCSEMNQGVILREVLGLHTANSITGDFSLGACGFWLEKGVIEHPIRDFTFSGYIFQIFREIIALGADFQFSGGFGAPSLLLEPQHLAGG